VLANRLKTIRILWGSLMASVCMILVVVFVAKNPNPQPPEPMMAPAFALVALMVAGMSFFLPANMKKTAFKNMKLELEEVADTGASDVLPYRDAPKRRVFANPKEAARRAFMIYQTSTILECALSEAVGLGFLGFPPPIFIPFFVVSLSLMALRFPTVNKAFGPMERHFDAKLPLDGL
jgi:hypothetical protein